MRSPVVEALKALGLPFAGFGMRLALGDPLASPAFHQGALAAASGLWGPLGTAHLSVCWQYPDPWLLAAFPTRGVSLPPGL